jgi:endonuclease-3
LDAPVKRMPARGAYRTLVGAVLSTRTQDPVTALAADRLTAVAPGPRELARLEPAAVEELIYPVGFYHTKAKALPELGRILVERHGGRVPATMAELLELPGVGRKVANIVLAVAFGQPAIAVDTHVQRISNRLGLVRTARPEQTEAALERILPVRFKGRWNALIVALGQTVCRPNNPRCADCPIERWCRRVGVKRTGNA